MSGQDKSVSRSGKSAERPRAKTVPMADDFDVLIIGAGLSGIGAAWRLRQARPGASFAILEARSAIGGTWDLFRYPGVRSDSDMFTLSYPFRPWRGAASMASGASIRDYLRETADEAGITAHIRFGTRVESATWSSSSSTTVTPSGHSTACRSMRRRVNSSCSSARRDAARPRCCRVSAASSLRRRGPSIWATSTSPL